MSLNLESNQLPNLIIIGAMKCGTTSLHHYLSLHPEIHMSKTKELDFFIKEKNWKQGINWYRAQFTESASIIGESSPNYTKYPAFQGVPERMAQLLPEAKLIYLVRDPIPRIISHYLHQYIDRSEKRSFKEAFASLENNHYVRCSLYSMQLDQFLEFYPISRILVVSLEELIQDRIQTLKKIFSFLQVDPTFKHESLSSVLHQTRNKQRLTPLGATLFRLPMGGRLASALPFSISYEVETPTIDTSLQQELENFLAPDVKRLRELTNSSFSLWTL